MLNRLSTLTLAAALALLSPLESARCVSPENHAAPTRANAAVAHECCASGQAAASHHAPKTNRSHGEPCTSSCACLQVPAGPPAAGIAVEGAISATSPVAVTNQSLDAPRDGLVVRVEALDRGSPPRPDDPGAHRLRAPPATA